MENSVNKTVGLKKGNPGNKGGGRPPDWLKAKCQDIVKNKKLIEFLAAVAGGEPFIEKVSIVDSGKAFEKTIHSADVKDRLKALEMLFDRGWGKAAQAISNPDGSNLAGLVLIRAA